MPATRKAWLSDAEQPEARMARWGARVKRSGCAAGLVSATITLMGLGCGSVTTSTGGDGGAGATTNSTGNDGPHVTVLSPDADPLPGQSTCEVTITTDIPISGAAHVELCTPVEYPTNPPSGGDHWGYWTSYTSYIEPVPREMYVHNMEHGSVILLYNCDGDCPEVVAALEEARQAVTGDPKCLQIPEGPTERVVITPDPLLDVPIAAATWGATYRATCIDVESLTEFAKAHYDRGTESTCAQCYSPTLCGSGGGGGAGGGGAGAAGGGKP